MMGWVGATALALSITQINNAYSMDIDWVRSKDELSSLSKLTAGYAGGLTCDRLIDTAVADKYLSTAFAGRNFSPNEVVQIMKMLIGVQAMESNFPGRDTKEAYCVTIEKSFGPSGNTIKGLLD
jgi:hypothetical protein